MPAKTPGLLRHGPALRLTEHRHFDTHFREHLGPGVATRAVRSALIARQVRPREADRSTLWRPDVPHRGTHKGHSCQEGVRIWPGDYAPPG